MGKTMTREELQIEYEVELTPETSAVIRRIWDTLVSTDTEITFDSITTQRAEDLMLLENCDGTVTLQGRIIQ